MRNNRNHLLYKMVSQRIDRYKKEKNRLSDRGNNELLGN